MTGQADVSPPNTARKTAHGVAWIYAGYVFDKLCILATAVVLARLLTPEEFGVAASALLVITILNGFRDFGFSDAVIYLDDPKGETAETSFTFLLLIGAALTVLLACVVLIAVPPGLLASLLIASAPVFLINGLSATHLARLKKELRFVLIARIDVFASLIKTVVALGTAAIGFGVWSLALGLLAAAVIRAMMLWVSSGWLPRLSFVRDSFWALFHFGKPLFANRVIDSFLSRADQIWIFSVLGSTSVGIYFIATRIPEMLLTQVCEVLTRVTYPLYASVNADPNRLRAQVLGTTRYVALVMAPIGVGLALISDLAIAVVFGPQWEQAAAPMAILALAGLAHVSTFAAGDGFKASGRPDLILKLTLIELAYSMPLIGLLIGYFQTLTAACLGVFLSALIWVGLNLHMARRQLQIAPADWLSAASGAIISVCAMTAAVLTVRWAMADAPMVFELVASILTGGLVYAACAWRLEGEGLRAVYTALRARA